MLDNVQSSFTSAFKRLKSRGVLGKEEIDNVLNDIRIALIDADVAQSVIDEFLNEISVKVEELNIEKSKSINPSSQIVKIISDELTEILGKDVDRPLNRAKVGPTIIMLIGLQGAGKTTLAGKLGHYLKANGHTPLLVACDLQRPGAVQQLEIVGEGASVPVFSPNKGVNVDGEVVGDSDEKKSGLLSGLFGNKDGRDSSKEAVRVATDSIKYAKERYYDTVIIDTAGRLSIDEELLKQAADIKQAVNPDEVLFVLDSTTGQDAVKSALNFDEHIGFTGAVLTKFDSDARGGAALSVAKVTNKPILFSGTGEKLEDLEVFHPERVASRILDQGDILTLLENAEEKLDSEVLTTSATKLIQGEDFDLNDFLTQMQQMKKLGSIKNLMGMIPGMGQFKNQLDNFDDSMLTGIEAIIQSMTPWERANPKQIKGSRKARIANGSGNEVSSVNQLLDRFAGMQKMMKNMMKGAGGKGRKAGGGGLANMLGGLGSDAISDLGALGANDVTKAGIDPNASLGDLGADDLQSLSNGLGGDISSMLGGFSMGQNGLNMPSNRSNSKRKGKANNKKKGKSGNPAKRAAEEAARREAIRNKFQ